MNIPDHVLLFSLPVFSGLLLALTLPLADLGALVWVALVPLLIFIHHSATSTRAALWGAVITGTLYGCAVLFPLGSLNAWWWIDQQWFVWEYRSLILYAFLAVLGAISGGLFFLTFSYIYKKLATHTLADAFVFPLLWITMEMFRTYLVLGFTWGQLGYALHDHYYISQIASIFGVYGLSFIAVAVNILLYLAYRNINEHRASPAKARVFLFDPAMRAVALVIIGVNLLGFLLIQTHTPDRNIHKNVAAIYTDKKTEELRGIEGFEYMVGRMAHAAAHRVDLVVLPENSFPFLVIDLETMLPLQYDNNATQIPILYDELRALSRTHPETYFVIGVHSVYKDTPRTIYHNSAIVLKDGDIDDIYHKRRLMPLAEQVSPRWQEGHLRTFTAGNKTSPIKAGDVRVSPVICSEVIFPSLVSAIPADIIVNLSNDSIFSTITTSKQNHIMAKMRAIESRKYLIRSVKGGISSIVDPYGNILISSGEGGGVITHMITL